MVFEGLCIKSDADVLCGVNCVYVWFESSRASSVNSVQVFGYIWTLMSIFRWVHGISVCDSWIISNDLVTNDNPHRCSGVNNGLATANDIIRFAFLVKWSFRTNCLCLSILALFTRMFYKKYHLRIKKEIKLVFLVFFTATSSMFEALFLSVVLIKCICL